MNPFVTESVIHEEEVQIDVSQRLLQARILFVDELLNDQTAANIVATLLHLDKISNEKITMFLNLEVSDIRNVFMVYDTMQLLSAPIETCCVGTAMHEAVLLLAAGTKGMRVITKNADVCVSQVTNVGMSHSDLTNTKIFHKKVQKDNDNFLRELSKCTKKPLRSLKKDVERQLFLNPTQAVKYGIVDKVI